MTGGKFRFKIFTSFILFVTFLITTISGAILFIAPPGRVANWTSWNVLGFSKHEWSAFHVVFVAVFLTAGILHLFYFNWKPFWSYIKKKTQSGLNYKKEFWLAIALSVILLIGTAAKIPPIISLSELSEYISDSWQITDSRPPVAHAELLTLSEFARTINQPLDKVVSVLQDKGYIPTSNDQTIGALADKYGTSPSVIYALVKAKTTNNSGEELSPLKGTGSGYGRMEFKTLVKELGLSLEDAKQRLKMAGITKVKDNQTLREIGMENNMLPRDVLKVLAPEIS
jgi:hypothetical protein